MSDNTNTRIRENSFNPSTDANYTYFSAHDKAEIREAFKAGMDYEAARAEQFIVSISKSLALALRNYKASVTE